MNKMVDAIIVLGGGVTKEGDLSNVSKARLDVALHLFQKRIARFLIFSGGVSYRAQFSPPKTEAEAMKTYAIALGIPEKRIEIETLSKDTLGNAYFCKKIILEKRKWKDILIVSSMFHLLKVHYLFQKILGPKYALGFYGIHDPLSYKEEEHLQHREDDSLLFFQTLFEHVVDGDDEKIRKIMHRELSYYQNEITTS